MKPILLFPALASLFLASCKKAEDSSSTPPPSDPSQLQSVLLDTAPAGAVSITEARQNPTPGTEVVLAGKIMGKMNPFVDGRALLTLGDPAKLVSCDLMPGDSCETPWDVCCDESATIAQSIATIQVVDDQGRPLKSSLKGLGGMKELSSLVVKGVVAEGSGPENFLVNATGIHIAMVEPTKENPAQGEIQAIDGTEKLQNTTKP